MVNFSNLILPQFPVRFVRFNLSNTYGSTNFWVL